MSLWVVDATADRVGDVIAWPTGFALVAGVVGGAAAKRGGQWLAPTHRAKV